MANPLVDLQLTQWPCLFNTLYRRVGLVRYSSTNGLKWLYFLLISYIKCIKSFPAGNMGTNCEVDIDACALPNNTCPPRTQCLDLPNGLEYTCRLPCPQTLQVSKNILMHCLSSSAVLNLPINNSISSGPHMFKELTIFCLFLVQQITCVLRSDAATVSTAGK